MSPHAQDVIVSCYTHNHIIPELAKEGDGLQTLLAIPTNGLCPSLHSFFFIDASTYSSQEIVPFNDSKGEIMEN